MLARGLFCQLLRALALGGQGGRAKTTEPGTTQASRLGRGRRGAQTAQAAARRSAAAAAAAAAAMAKRASGGDREGRRDGGGQRRTQQAGGRTQRNGGWMAGWMDEWAPGQCDWAGGGENEARRPVNQRLSCVRSDEWRGGREVWWRTRRGPKSAFAPWPRPLDERLFGGWNRPRRPARGVWRPTQTKMARWWPPRANEDAPTLGVAAGGDAA